MRTQNYFRALNKISDRLAEGKDLKTTLYDVLGFISKQAGMEHLTVSLLNPLRNEIHIEVAYGLSESSTNRVRYKLGEGITGQAIKGETSIIIPKVSQTTQFMNKTRAISKDKEYSFWCVPIWCDNKVIGTLGADRGYDQYFNLNEAKEFLKVVCAMISSFVSSLEKKQYEKEQLKLETKRIKTELEDKYSIRNIVGSSSEMREVFSMVSRVSKSNATVLIRGESGTGKELVASSIHFNSKRSEFPFIKVNCAALPPALIESELFGHEKGAFTGAIKQKRGKFELANHGTIFLDEIGDISLDAQANLLRVLQEKEFDRVGGQNTIKIDVRVIAATNKNLEKCVEEGSFREDLYYRLNVFPIYMPALRERKSDVLLITEHFIEKYSKETGKEIARISTPAIDMLTQYHWPGNVRELENCIERAVLLCEDGVIHAHHLPPSLQTGQETGTMPIVSLEGAVANLEKEMIIDALKNTRGNIKNSAELLKTTVRKLAYKAEQYGISYKSYR